MALAKGTYSAPAEGIQPKYGYALRRTKLLFRPYPNPLIGRYLGKRNGDETAEPSEFNATAEELDESAEEREPGLGLGYLNNDGKAYGYRNNDGKAYGYRKTDDETPSAYRYYTHGAYRNTDEKTLGYGYRNHRQK